MATEIIKEYYQNDGIADRYDAERFASLSGRTFDALEKRALRRMIRRAVAGSSAPSVLDVPCGTGRITRVLLEEGLSVTGADISCEMMAIAEKKCAAHADRLQFQRLDLDAVDLPENQYDLVSCVRMLHHLDAVTRRAIFGALAKLSRRYVLVNVSLSTPFYRWRRRMKRRLGQGVSRESMTWNQILDEVSSAGLQIVAKRFVARWLSEDLILLLEKEPSHDASHR